MEEMNAKIEAILFAAGREVSKKEIVTALEISEEQFECVIGNMKDEYELDDKRGIEIIQVEDSYMLCSKTNTHKYIYNILDKRVKPKLSNASLETLAIVAYNNKITRAEVEVIRGVSADGCIYKLQEYGLIEEAGKSDLPGKPMTYKITNEFFKTFGYESGQELPELPRYKLDENRQIVIDDILEEKEKNNEIITNRDGDD